MNGQQTKLALGKRDPLNRGSITLLSQYNMRSIESKSAFHQQTKFPTLLLRAHTIRLRILGNLIFLALDNY